MADLFLILLVIAALGLAVYLIRKDRQMTRLEQDRLRRLRDSDLYARMYPTVRKLRRMDIESIRIRAEDVCITFMSQPGRGIRFDLIRMGFRPMTQDEMTTLALMLERDIDVLADRSRYRMRRESRELMNGTRTWQYMYVVRHNYKNAVNRAPYYERRAA